MKQLATYKRLLLVLLMAISTQITITSSNETETDLASLDDFTLLNEIATAAPELVFVARVPCLSIADVTIELGDSTFPLTRGLLETLYNTILSTNPYCKLAANVRILTTPTTLASQENLFLEKRDTQTHKALEILLGRTLEPNEQLRIGICASGGGFRALLSMEGMLEGFELENILDTVTYISTLSGSTWAVAPWLITDQDYSDFGPLLKKRVAKSIFNKTLNEQLTELNHSLSIVTDCFLRRLAFNENPSVIDFYGLMLGLSLFSAEEKKQYLSTSLASQFPHIANGQRPYPIYTAVIAHKKPSTYSWLEFSPDEVRCPAQRWAVPSWAYGRKFDKGISQNTAPALTLGYLMGTWGSAISFSVNEACMHTIAHLNPQELFKPLQNLISSSQIGGLRFFPAIIPNPGFNLPPTPDNSTKNHTVIDGGFEQDLPLLPLLNPERKIDLIIICDSSADVAKQNPLKKIVAYAEKHAIPLPPIDFDKAFSQPFSLFDGGPHSKAPMILYFPLIKNPHYSTTFNPQDYLGLTGFLNTTNFCYSEHDIKLISGLFNYTAREASDTIKTIIEIILHRKKIGFQKYPTSQE